MRRTRPFRRPIRWLALIILAGGMLGVLAPGVQANPGSARTGSDLLPFSADIPTEVLHNSWLSLAVDPATGRVIIQDLETGRIHATNPGNPNNDPRARGVNRMRLASQIVITMIDGKGNLSESTSAAGSVAENGLSLFSSANRLRAVYRFPTEGISLSLDYSISGRHLVVEVPFDQVLEDKDKRLVEVEVLPFFGSAGSEEKGFFLLPDGSGSISAFEPGTIRVVAPVALDVFGSDPSLDREYRPAIVPPPVLLPVFGLSSEGAPGMVGGGFLAAIREGAAVARIHGALAGKDSGQNTTWSSFQYRGHAQVSLLSRTWAEKTFERAANDPVSLAKYSVQYAILPEGAASIDGMASAAREFLGWSSHDPGRIPPVFLDITMGIRRTVYDLGFPRQKYIRLTSFDEGLGMIRAFEALPTVVRLNGMDRYGAFEGPVDTGVSVAGALGGMTGLDAFLDDAQALGASVFPALESTRATRARWGYVPFLDGAHTLSGRIARILPYRPSTYQQDPSGPVAWLMRPDATVRALDSIRRDALAHSLPGIAPLSASSRPWSSHGRNPTDRQACANALAESYRHIRESGIGLLLETPAAYGLPYASALLAMPVRSAGLDLSAASVPFVQMVLHGWIPYSTEPINQSADPRRMVLRAIETGSSLSFRFMAAGYESVKDSPGEILQGCRFSDWMEVAVRSASEAAEALRDLGDVPIVGYRILSADVRETTFGDGTVILVNYGTKEYRGPEGIVPSESYLRLDPKES